MVPSDLRTTLNSSVKKLCDAFEGIDHVLWHGSLARGMEVTCVSDVDLCLSLLPSPLDRMVQVQKAVSVYQELNTLFIQILNNDQPTALSCLLITKGEIDWNIVKGCKKDDFFTDETLKVLVKGNEAFFVPADALVYRRQAMREIQASSVFTNWIWNTQSTRKLYVCGVPFLSIGKSSYANCEEYFKGFCRHIDETFNGTNEQNNGYQYLRTLILEESKDDNDLARKYVSEVLTLDLKTLPQPDVLMLMWEYVLDAALKKLDALIPPIDEIFKDYNESVQRGWLEQWGYARDPKGAYLDKNGRPLLGEDKKPIRDWSQHQSRIVQEGLNTGSVEYADLFARNPDMFAPSDCDELAESASG